jgi:hypothetical protein
MPDEFENPFIDASNVAFMQSLVGAPRSADDLKLFLGTANRRPTLRVSLSGLHAWQLSLSRVGGLVDGLSLKQFWALRL